MVAQPPRKRQVAGSNPARGSREASATPVVRRAGRPGARRHGRLPLRRWCNGKHGGLQNRRSGFESRPACERNVAQLAARAAGGREAAGSSPAIPTWENPARPSLPAWGRNTPHGSNATGGCRGGEYIRGLRHHRPAPGDLERLEFAAGHGDWVWEYINRKIKTCPALQYWGLAQDA